MSEESYYPEINKWLCNYLTEKYRKHTVLTTFETSRQSLDIVLKKNGIIINEAIGLNIKIDIIGIIKNKFEHNDIIFVEVKDKPLTLKDLGQLWGYTQLINPLESFLISTESLGSLQHLFKIHKREDLLCYGTKKEKTMKTAVWDKIRKIIEPDTIFPKS